MELKEIVKIKEKKLQCGCDFDTWEPERETGHTFICRIHLAAIEEFKHPTKKTEYTQI